MTAATSCASRRCAVCLLLYRHLGRPPCRGGCAPYWARPWALRLGWWPALCRRWPPTKTPKEVSGSGYGCEQSQPGRHAAMPVSRRIGTGAHCISRCGSRTKSTPSARPMAASRWQHSTATPGGARGSGASLEVNSPEISSGMGTPSRRHSDRRRSSCKPDHPPCTHSGHRPWRHSGHNRSGGPWACARYCARHSKCIE